MRYVLLLLLLAACHDPEATVSAFPNGCTYADTIPFTDGSGFLVTHVTELRPAACDSAARDHTVTPL